MRYKKGLALFLAAALTVSMVTQMGERVSATEMPDAQAEWTELPGEEPQDVAEGAGITGSAISIENAEDAEDAEDAQEDEGISVMSLLPLEECEATLELYGSDFSAVSIETILQRLRLKKSGAVVEVAKDAQVDLAYDADDYIPCERGTGTVDLSALAKLSESGGQAGIRMIIGKGTQLDAQAVRYLVNVSFYSGKVLDDISYTVDGRTYNYNYNGEYGSFSVEGVNVPVTTVRYYNYWDTSQNHKLAISSKMAKRQSENGKQICGNDIKVAVYQMQNFIDAYDSEKKTLNSSAVPLEGILTTPGREGAYGELNPDNPLESDNLFCVVYQDTATGKVLEYQGLAFIVCSSEPFLQGKLYDKAGEKVQDLGIKPQQKVYSGVRWNVDLTTEPGRGIATLSDQNIYTVSLPAGYPGDKTYYYVIDNTAGLINRVEVCDSKESWTGTDVTEAVFKDGYGITCGEPVYFTVYAKGGMILRYCVSVAASGEIAGYSYRYGVGNLDGSWPNTEAIYKPDETYPDTKISVTPVTIYRQDGSSWDQDASYKLVMYPENSNPKVKVDVYQMADFLDCYDVQKGTVSGLKEKSAITEWMFDSGYEGTYAKPDSKNVFAVVYSNPDDGKILAYHGISVQFADNVSSVSGKVYTYVDGEKKALTTDQNYESSPSAVYGIDLGKADNAVVASRIPGKTTISQMLPYGYLNDRDYYFILDAEKASQVEKVMLAGEDGKETDDVTKTIFEKGYPAKYDKAVLFHVYFKDGTQWNYSVRAYSSEHTILDSTYKYSVSAASDSSNVIAPSRIEYMSYALDIPVDVTKVVFYAKESDTAEGKTYRLRINGSGITSSYDIETEVYLMKDFVEYCEAKAEGKAAVLDAGKKITDLFSRYSYSSPQHTGTYADPADGADAMSADNMFCIVYRSQKTGEILACQGVLFIIRPQVSDVSGTFYIQENASQTKLADTWGSKSAEEIFSSKASYQRVKEDTAGTSVARYKTQSTYQTRVELTAYNYEMPTGYKADGQYSYVMAVPGGDRSKVKAVLGSYESLQEAETADAKDVTAALMPEGETASPYGYTADYSKGVVFTIFVGADQVLNYKIRTKASNYVRIQWQYNLYAGEGTEPVGDGQIARKVYMPCQLPGIEMPVTKVLYYVSDESLKDTETWRLAMNPLESMADKDIDVKAYRMADFLEKKGDPITDLLDGSGHQGAYSEPDADVANADNLFCIVYTNHTTGEVMASQGVLFAVKKEAASAPVEGSVYRMAAGKELQVISCEAELFASVMSGASQWIGGSSPSLDYTVERKEYLYTLPADCLPNEDYRYVLKKNENVKKVVKGAWPTAEKAAAGTDITAALLGAGEVQPVGYKLECGAGADNTFTVVYQDGSVLQYKVTLLVTEPTTVSSVPAEYIPPKEGGDPYFKVTGAVTYNDNAGTIYGSGYTGDEKDVTYTTVADQVYVIRNDDKVTLDTSYGYGYQTVLIADENADLTKLSPIFELGSGVKAYVGREQFSGRKDSIHDFSERSVLYNVFIGSSLRNYQVTFAKKTTGGANLFVNGPEKREVFLTQTHEYKNDILIANLGDEPLTDLKVELSKDAKNVRLDDYWTVGGDNNKELAAFTTVSSSAQYGELDNLAKIRLLQTDTYGKVEGKVTISGKDSKGHEFKKIIELTGWAINPEITTEELDPAVKFVPYSYVISTNNMHYEWNKVTFSIVEEKAGGGKENADAKWQKLPEGLSLDEDTGEIYGVPQAGAVGNYQITVKADYSRRDLFTPSIAQFELEVRENEDQTVFESSDYKLMTAVGEAMSNYRYVVTEIRDQAFDSYGPYGEFVALYLNGKKLEASEYTSRSGSTKTVVLAQTFQNKAKNGRNTLAAEFRVNGEQKTGDVVNQLHRTAQNFTLDVKAVKPDVTPTPAPSGDPDVTPTPAPSGDPDATPTPAPGGDPDATPTPAPGGDPNATPTPTPAPGGSTNATPTPAPGGSTDATPTPAPGGSTDATPTPAPGGNADGSGGSGNSGSAGNSGGAGSNAGASAVSTATIVVRMADLNGNPLAGYVVEIHSTPKTATLDKNGEAVFTGVEGGKHTMYVRNPSGNIVALKEFELAFGENMSLAGSRIQAKSGMAYTFNVQLSGSELIFSGLQENRALSPKTGDFSTGCAAIFWIALSLGAVSGIFLYGKRRSRLKK